MGRDLGLEKLVADDTGGRFRPGSGCLWFAKGDVINDVFLVECKSSNSGRLRIAHQWIKTIRRHASKESKCWGLAVATTMMYTDQYVVLMDPGTAAMFDIKPVAFTGVKGSSMEITAVAPHGPEVPTEVTIAGEKILILHRNEFIELNENMLKEKGIL